MGEICVPNVEPDHEAEIEQALEAVSKCTKAHITVEIVKMLKINWPDDHPELGSAIRAIVGIKPEVPHIKHLGRPRKPKLDPMGS